MTAFQDLALRLEPAHLAPTATQLLALLGRQPVTALTRVKLGLLDSVAQRLRRDPQLVGELRARAAHGAHPTRSSPA